MKKGNMIFDWAITITLLVSYGFVYWIYKSTLNGGIWAKYGQQIAIAMLIAAPIIFIILSIVRTIIYIRDKKRRL